MIRKLSWDEVFDGWRKQEEELWRPVYEGFGWDSWAAWRKMMIADLNLEKRTWTEEILEDPHSAIPSYAIGGWNGWKKYRPAGKDSASFADIATPPQLGEQSYDGAERIDIRTNEKIQPLIGRVSDATIIALRCDKVIAVLDGTHRCAAIAIEAHDSAPLSKGIFTMLVAQFDDSEKRLFEAFCRDRPRSKKVL